MKSSFLGYATLLGVSLAVACSSQPPPQQQALSGGGAQTPFPTAKPLQNMNQAGPRSCATSGPGQPITEIDSHTGLPIVLAPGEYISAWVPFWFSQQDAFRWTISKTGSSGYRYVYPMVPIIDGKVSMGSHDEATIAILPYGSANDRNIFNLYLQHIEFTDKVAAEARAAKINNTQLPTPTPQESAAEQYFFASVQPVLQADGLGAAPDDTDYQNAPGNPDAQSPHLYDFVCKYMDDTQYALIWNVETRIAQVSYAKTAVQATLAANKAQPAVIANVGWVPDKYITLVAAPIRPMPILRVILDSPSPGANAVLATTYPFVQKAFIDLTPVPTPTPSPAPTP